MIFARATACILVVFSQAAFAQKISTPTPKTPAGQVAASDETCARLNKFVDGNLRSIAFERMSGASDNSAPRATNRLLTEVSYMSAINATLTQMALLKCTPSDLTIDPDAYYPEALSCGAARASASLGITGASDKVKEACDAAKWKRLP